MALLKVERAQGKGAKGVFSTTALLPCPRPRRHLGVLADAAPSRRRRVAAANAIVNAAAHIGQISKTRQKLHSKNS